MRTYEDIMNVAVVNFRQVWGNKESNLARIKGYIRAAAKAGADLVVFPEMALNGYDNEMEVEWDQKMQVKTAETVPGPSSEAIAEVTKKYEVYAIFGMAERATDGSRKVYNSACVCGPDGVIGAYRKIHPALAESCWCTRGSEPFSFETPWGPIGVGICYDSYNFHELARYYAAMGCRLYCNPTAIGPGDRMEWKEYYTAGLKDIVSGCEIFVASSNLCGTADYDEDEGGSYGNIKPLTSLFGGGSMILGPGIAKKIHTFAGSVDNMEEEIVIATIDLSQAARRIFKVDPIKGCPDFRPDIYRKMNEELLKSSYWKQFIEK